MNRLYLLSILFLFIACKWDNRNEVLIAPAEPVIVFKTVLDIQPPGGYKRISLAKDSFGEWLRNIPVRKDHHVYLFNGLLKKNQSAQFAVLDIKVGKKDLQQCADAVMRLRAEYLFNQKRYADIEFRDNAGKSYKWAGGNDRLAFELYLENVFGWCGSASLEKQLKMVSDIKDMLPGDVFIKGGFPGHAMIVMDVAVNDNGNKVFMLAQSYMPAQDIHIVKNPAGKKVNPWYEVNDIKKIITPEWTFYENQLRRWQ